jgi:DNA-nicking Smr family endonuclease
VKPSKRAGIHRPFEALKELLSGRHFPEKRASPPPAPHPPAPSGTRRGDDLLFAQAMAGVDRIDWNSGGSAAAKPPPAAAPQPDGSAEDVECLKQLIDTGLGFRVADTPEYMEGIGWAVPPEIARRLHRGDFAVQAHLDMHGLTAAHAREAFDAFMREALLSGKRAVLIIHGRGLSSPAEPVLKTKVNKWLSGGRWRKWVLAFTSARMCDGGAGASYVLLRCRPLKKKNN